MQTMKIHYHIYNEVVHESGNADSLEAAITAAHKAAKRTARYVNSNLVFIDYYDENLKPIVGEYSSTPSKLRSWRTLPPNNVIPKQSSTQS